MKDKTHTLEQIKQAFWNNFHETGELLFDYLVDEENNEESTKSHWEDFLEELNKLSQ